MPILAYLSGLVANRHNFNRQKCIRDVFLKKIIPCPHLEWVGIVTSFKQPWMMLCAKYRWNKPIVLENYFLMFSMYFTSATFYRTYNLEGFIVTLPDQYIKSLQRYFLRVRSDKNHWPTETWYATWTIKKTFKLYS